MLICQRTPGCSKLDGHSMPCDSDLPADPMPLTAPDVRTAANFSLFC